MFYNPTFEFDEIDMIKIPEGAFDEKKTEDIQYPVDTEHLEYTKPNRTKKPNRRNLSNWILKQISREYKKLKNSTKIEIEQNEEDTSTIEPDTLHNNCMIDDDDDDDDTCKFSNSIMLPSRRILPVWKLNKISKDFMATNVSYSRKKKPHKKSSVVVIVDDFEYCK